MQVLLLLFYGASKSCLLPAPCGLQGLINPAIIHPRVVVVGKKPLIGSRGLTEFWQKTGFYQCNSAKVILHITDVLWKQRVRTSFKTDILAMAISTAWFHFAFLTNPAPKHQNGKKKSFLPKITLFFLFGPPFIFSKSRFLFWKKEEWGGKRSMDRIL